MKNTILLLLALITISCSHSEKNSTSENESLEHPSEPEKEEREIHEKLKQESAVIHDASIKENITSSADSLLIKNPAVTIQRIFDAYNQYQESTDSPSNLDSLKQSLKLLESIVVDEETLTLVINVWMYYSVTDFPTRAYTEAVFLAHRAKSILTLEKRIQHKMDWETDEGAPFSELSPLLERLEDN